jgi:hypothetical protein
MKQYAKDGTQIELELLAGHLLFGDPLYFQDIIDDYLKIDTSTITDKIARNIF